MLKLKLFACFFLLQIFVQAQGSKLEEAHKLASEEKYNEALALLENSDPWEPEKALLRIELLEKITDLADWEREETKLLAQEVDFYDTYLKTGGPKAWGAEKTLWIDHITVTLEEVERDYLDEKGEALASALESLNNFKFVEAFVLLEKGADEGKAAFMTYLGALHFLPALGPDPEKGVALMEQAAKKGYGPALCYLGDHYYSQQNYEEARKYYELMDSKGFAVGAERLGKLYFYGHGVPEDYKKCVAFYNRASHKGLLESMVFMAKYYESGPESGAPEEIFQAVALYEKAALKEHKEAMFRLGTLLLEGREPLPPNMDLGMSWLQKASDNQQQEAMAYLADAYYHGKGGLSKDYTKAADYYRQLSNWGDKQAQYQMYLILEEGGHGISQDKDLAQQYLERYEGKESPRVKFTQEEELDFWENM